jgi:hypothetical protein
MAETERAAPKRSPLRRRLETSMQLGALAFFVVLGSAIYQNVSRGMPTAHGTSASASIEARSNNARPAETKPRAGEPVPPSQSGVTPGMAPPSDAKSRQDGTVITGSTRPAPESVPPIDMMPPEQEPSATATIQPSSSNVALLSPASLDCAAGSPAFWEFANVELIDSTSSRAHSLVTSCRITQGAVGPVACQHAVIVGVGMASSKGINEIESARALRRGINLVSALKEDLQTRCANGVDVAAYVLNLGRYSSEQRRDEPDQRKVIALVATGSQDIDQAATDVVVTYAKSDPKIAHYPICELYKLDNAGRPTLVSTQHNICSDQSGRTVSQR